MQATEKFTERTQAEKHIRAGAKKVIITAPGRGDNIPTYVVVINDSKYSHDKHNIIRLRKQTSISFLSQSHVTFINLYNLLTIEFYQGKTEKDLQVAQMCSNNIHHR